MTAFVAEPALDRIHVLAEGPFWDPLRERVIWVDINGRAVHTGTFSGGRITPVETLSFDGTVGTVVCSAAGDLLVAEAHHLTVVRTDGRREAGPELVPAGRTRRLNDGGCDPAGRFLVGSLSLQDDEGGEELFRVVGDDVTVLDRDLSLSNGLGFSPDGTRFYSTDTIPGLIRVRDYDPATGATGPRQEFLKISEGFPDGLCVDAEGNLWVAIWGAGQVRCYSPAGRRLATVAVDAPNTSSVAFIGPDLDTLLITTASEQLTAAQRERHPDSGKLFTASVGVAGLPVPYWSGV